MMEQEQKKRELEMYEKQKQIERQYMLERERGIIIVNRVGDFIDHQDAQYGHLKKSDSPKLAEEGPLKGFQTKVAEYEKKFSALRSPQSIKKIESDSEEVHKKMTAKKTSQMMQSDKKGTNEKDKKSKKGNSVAKARLEISH